MSELQVVLDRTVKFVTDSLQAGGGSSIILWDKIAQRFVQSSSTVRQQHDNQIAANRVRSSGGATRWIVDNRKPVIVADIKDDPFKANSILREYGINAYIGVPLIIEDTVEGVLYAMYYQRHDFRQEEIDLLISCAGMIGLAISKARAVEELEETNNALELYVRTVTHDIKSPLSVALGYLNLVNSEYELLGNEEKQEYLNASEQMLFKSFQIIDELLLLTEIRNEHAVVYTPIDMSEVLSEVEKRMRPLLDQSNATLEIPSQWESKVMGYPPWVEEIWVNFISNAIKYGGSPPEIKIGSTCSNNEIQFWIKDNGTGLTAEQQKTLFEPFTRFNLTRIQGHGLGLSIVRHITERMNGTVGVQSEAGQGARFYFTLPIAIEEEQQSSIVI